MSALSGTHWINLLGPTLAKKSGPVDTAEALNDKVVGLFIGSRSDSNLVRCYTEIKESGKDFEIVFFPSPGGGKCENLSFFFLLFSKKHDSVDR